MPLIAVGLAACQPVPMASMPLPAPPVTGSDYRAISTEPFWDLTIGHDMVFTDRGTGVSVVEHTPPRMGTSSRYTYRGGQIDVDITPGPCSDGMSDRIYPDTVRLSVEGRPYRGCGASAAFFGTVGENGVRGIHDLADTNWRMVSIVPSLLLSVSRSPDSAIAIRSPMKRVP